MLDSDIPADRWPALSALLDEVLDLPPEQRDGWLESLAGDRADLRDTLRRLLQAGAGIETGSFLATLPKFAGAAAAADAGPGAGARVGPYELIEEAGRGGMGTVWRARRADGQVGRDVALKLPLPSRWRHDLAQRFAREREILARLEHPHIARLYDAGVSADGLPYLALEFVAGQPIDQWCDARRLGLAGRLALFAQVLEAVQYAHARLVIHRDLKPGNILVTEDGQVRLLDFGIAKLLEADDTARETALTQQAGRVLTPDYASPEQVQGESLTTASDLYSLGVVLCELLCGRRPYRLAIASAAQLEMAIVSAEPARPSSLAAEAGGTAAAARGTTPRGLARALAGDLDAIVAKALAKAPAARYASAAAFAEDLARHARGEPVLAERARWSYRFGKFVRRNRVAVAAGTVAFATLGIAAAVALQQAQAAREQARRAEDVKRFVLSIFESAETGAGGTRSTSALELLAQAQRRLAAAPPQDTPTRVELLGSVGVSIASLGDMVGAQPVLEEAVRLAGQALPPSDTRRLAAELALGRVLLLRGEQHRAAPIIEGAEAGARASGDPALLVRALRWKSNLRVSEGHGDAAVAAAREAVQVADALPGEGLAQDRLVQEANMLAANTLEAMRRPGALPYAERALAAALRLHGDGPSPEVLNARSQVAEALTGLSRFDEAATILGGLVQQQIALLGANHADVGRTWERLGAVSLLLGQAQAALDAFQNALAIAEVHAAGRPARSVAARVSNVGTVNLALRRFEAAEAAFARGIEVGEAAGGDYEAYMGSRVGRVEVLLRSGRLDEAERALAAIAERLNPASGWMPLVHFRRGLLRSAQGRHDDAEVSLAAAVAGTGRDPRLVALHARMMCALGIARVEAGRMQAAADVLEPGLAKLQSLQSKVLPERAEGWAALARAQAALGRHDAAIESARAAVAFWDGQDAAHPYAQAARRVLAEVEAAQRQARR